MGADIAEGKLSSTVQENLTGVRVVRAFGRENFEIERFDEKNNAFSELWIRLGHMMTAYWSTGDLITALQVLTVIAVGTVSAVNGEITLGEFLAFVSYNATLNWPVRALGKILAEMSKTGVSISRISYILHAQPEQDPPEALTPPMDRDICFEHVTFGYENQKPVLDDVSFTIPAGKTFAPFVGGTGSGKNDADASAQSSVRFGGGRRQNHHRRRGHQSNQPRTSAQKCVHRFAGAIPVFQNDTGKYRHCLPGEGQRADDGICAQGSSFRLCG